MGSSYDDHHRIAARFMSRYETVNSRLNTFNVLERTFQQTIPKHEMFCDAVASIMKLLMANVMSLFDI